VKHDMTSITYVGPELLSIRTYRLQCDILVGDI